ncbi:MAG TPA: hypothetical protein VJ957_06135, partial [Longimicrobiales bacterium]|nr:hypothetical protein [Longimicrobiales bacterium]
MFRTTMPDQPNLPRPAFALVVSERPHMRDAIERVIGEDDFVLLAAPTRRDVRAWTQDVPADVVFIDGAFEDGYGLTLFAEMEHDLRVPAWTPRFVVHDGVVPADRVVQGLAAGAWDVLQLPLDQFTLRLRLHSMVRGKLEADSALENAMVDELTGLYTWPGLVERIEELGALAYRNRRPIACVAFGPDLARTTGEDVDGAALRELADHMATVGRATVRRSDLLG